MFTLNEMESKVKTHHGVSSGIMQEVWGKKLSKNTGRKNNKFPVSRRSVLTHLLKQQREVNRTICKNVDIKVCRYGLPNFCQIYKTIEKIQSLSYISNNKRFKR